MCARAFRVHFSCCVVMKIALCHRGSHCEAFCLNSSTSKVLFVNYFSPLSHPQFSVHFSWNEMLFGHWMCACFFFGTNVHFKIISQNVYHHHIEGKSFNFESFFFEFRNWCEYDFSCMRMGTLLIGLYLSLANCDEGMQT